MVSSKDKVYNAALELFTKEGFHGTSMAKIADNAGVSNGSLFHHFKTKEELVSSLFLKTKKEYIDYVKGNMDEVEPSKELIKQIYYRCVIWKCEHESAVLFLEMFYSSPYLDKVSKQEASRYLEDIIELIRNLVVQELVIDEYFDLVVNSMHGSILSAYNCAKKGNYDLNKLINFSFDMWWKSVKTQ